MFVSPPIKGFVRLGLLYTSANKSVNGQGTSSTFLHKDIRCGIFLPLPYLVHVLRDELLPRSGMHRYAAPLSTSTHANNNNHICRLPRFALLITIIGYLTEPLRTTHKRRRSPIPSGIVLRPPMINSRCKRLSNSWIRLPLFPDRSLL